jgi:glycosyltransferase involved in cell wall biosynthesis
LHIGFDISQTGTGKAGCGFFAHSMCRAILDLEPQHHYTLFPSFGDFYFDAQMPLLCPYSGSNVDYGPRHLSREAAQSFWTNCEVEMALNKPDIVHSNNFWCPTQLVSSRLIYTFYDMGFAVDPTWTTETNRVGCFAGVFKSSLVADWVLAISEASRAHYLSIFPHFPSDRICVIYPCSRFVDSSLLGSRPKALHSIATHGFWLNVGTIEPRKNQRRLAEAYARYLALGGKAMPLVLAGGKGWLMDHFQSHLEQLGIAAHVILTGYVTDDELIWLYRNCYGNLYPSHFEGFGLPVLEGMQFGAPTLASTSTSIPEIATGAAVMCSPEDTEQWAQSMFRIASNTNEREQLGMSGLRKASRFSWKHSADALLRLYAEALASPKRQGIKCNEY